jgi:uncharacterized protein YndB with AHSA1/START domain
MAATTKKPRALRKEVFLPHAPERVWVALTDPRAIAEWLMPNTFRAEVGAEFAFRYDAQPGCGDGMTTCRVLELDPPRRMVWSWVNHKPGESPTKHPMKVEWTLMPERGGTRLVLVHSGLEHERWVIGLMMSFGWGTMLKRFIPKVMGGVSEHAPHGFTPGAIPLEKRCYRAQTVPAEFVR